MGLFGYKGEVKNVEHFRDDKDGPVTSVIKTNSDGSKDVYSNSKGIIGSSTHGHKSYDKDGNNTFSRDEGAKKGKWNGYLLTTLSNLSFSQLSMIESSTTNEYIKRSARMYMQQAKCFEQDDEYSFRL